MSGTPGVCLNKQMGAEKEKEGTHAFIESFYKGIFTEPLLCAREQRCKERHTAPCCKELTTLCPPHTSEKGVSQRLERKTQAHSTP